MDKKHFIKRLESIPGNPQIGVNVLTKTGSEFWVLHERAIQPLGNGCLLSLIQLRLKKPLPLRLQLKAKVPSVDSVDVSLADAVEQFKDRYSYDQLPPEDDLPEFVLMVIRKDLETLIRLNEDFLRLFCNPELTKKYGLDDNEN